MKNTLKKTLAMLLSMVMILSMTTMVMATETQVVPELISGWNSIYANGVPITIEAGSSSGTSKIKYGDNLYLDLDADSAGIQSEADLSGYDIYGGSGTSLESDTKVTMTGGKVMAIYGGGDSAGASVVNSYVIISGGETFDVYGGGNFSGASAENTSVKINGGTISQVYGGGNYGYVSGGTSVTVTGGAIGAIYGGSCGSSGLVKGDTSVTISGGTIDIVNGGGSAGAVNGNTFVKISGNANVTESDTPDGFSGYVYGGGSTGTVGGNTTVQVNGGTVSNVYGGGGNGTVSGNTTVQVSDGTVTNVYGSGRWGTVSGDTDILVSDGTVANVYGGGGDKIDTGAVNGDATVKISGGTVTYVYGGGNYGTVSGKTYVSVSGADVGRVYGGGYIGTVNENTSVNVTGGAITYVYGGGYADTATVDSTSITISGGTIRGVWGGGYSGVVNNDTSVNVAGGAVIVIYGGGNIGAVNGDTLVTITETAEITTNSTGVGAKIYGGGNSGNVNGSTFVIVSGGTFIDIDGAEITGEHVYGGCGDTGTVTGSKNGYVIFADKANADSFTNLLYKTTTGWESKGDSTIPVNQTITIENSETLTINEGESLTNNGTLILAGTLTGEGRLAGDGIFKKTLVVGDIITAETLIYTGDNITPVINTTTIMGMEFMYDTTEYTSTYQMKNGENWETVAEVKEIGDYKITFTKDTTIISAEFSLIGIVFDGESTALTVKQSPIYGDKWSDILSLDTSKISSKLNGQDITGTYALLIDNSSFDGTAIPNQGEYSYKVTFTAADYSEFKDVEILNGTVTVAKREVDITWNNITLSYNGENQIPTATITNKVGSDDVLINITGEQKNVGTSYIATSSLSGSNAENYDLPTLNTTTFSIIATTATGNVTVSSVDANGNKKLDSGDTVTAEITAVTPQGGTASYQWKKIVDSSTSNIGTNQNSYILTTSDVEGEIFCEVTFTGNTTGTIISNNLDIAKENLTGTIIITGDKTLGSTLTVSLPTNTGINASDYDIAWYRDNTAITGANTATYALVKEDLGKTIKVYITVKDESDSFTGILESNEFIVPATAPEKAVISASTGKNHVTLSWSEPFANGSEITGYSLIVRKDEIEITGSPFEIGNEVTSYKVESLSNGTTYSFIFSVTNGIGNTISDTVTATPKASSSSGSSSSSSSGGTVVTSTDPLSITVTNGTANATISDELVSDAIEKAQADANKNDTDKNSISIELNVYTGNEAVDSVTAKLSKNSFNQMVESGIKEVTLKNAAADISLNLETLKEIQKMAGDNIVISVKKVENNTLSVEAKEFVGDRPVFEFGITDEDGKQISDFGKGSVSVSIHYTLGVNENPANVVAYYIDANGKIEEISNSVYDEETETLKFATDHFSKFAVGYKETTVDFSDIEDHWAKESIEFVLTRGILTGTSNVEFSPNISMTRGMFVTALGRFEEVDIAVYTKSSFNDVNTDAYYMPFVEWASKNGIVNGTSTTTFLPDKEITREQMAVILSNYAKTIGFDLPQVYEENIFADNTKTNTWAKEAVKQMQIAGIINGKSDNLFDPQNTATRAEASAMLERFIKIIIESSK
jgi:hypothetical protein